MTDDDTINEPTIRCDGCGVCYAKDDMNRVRVDEVWTTLCLYCFDSLRAKVD
jgi:hypothetical protein